MSLESPAIPTVSASPALDGELEGVWQQALQVELRYETNPGENLPAKVKTYAYLMASEDTLYVAFDARDPHPAAIRAHLQDRDSAYNDDFVGIVLDTFNDERRAFEFFSNPLGIQMDLINDDVRRSESDSWNAIWESAGAIHDQGYVVEMAIPLRVLRFPEGVKAPVWGVDLLRMYPRDFRYRFANNPRDRSRACYLCNLEKIAGIKPQSEQLDLKLVPTLTFAKVDVRDDPVEDPWTDGDLDIEPGLDINWGVTQDTTVSATLNPDFSQVEADVAQLDVNRSFSLFFPERRPFFVDGAEYFNTHMNAVFTRNINDPDIGLKLTGKQGAHNYGVLAADDTSTSFIIPGAQGSDVAVLEDLESRNAVLRYRHDLDDGMTVGALFTQRDATDYLNRVLSVDGSVLLAQSDRIEAQILHSRSEYPRQVQQDFDQQAELDDTAYYLNYSHNGRDWTWYASYQDLGEDFRADMGFINRVDFNKRVIGLGHNWYAPDNSWWHRFRLNGDWDKSYDDDGNELEEEIEMYASINAQQQSYFSVGGGKRQQFFDGVFFDQNFYSAFAEVQPSGDLYLALRLGGGDRIDYANTRAGDVIEVSPRVTWRYGRHLQTRLRHTYQKLDVSQGKLYTANQSDLRVTYQFDQRSFVRLTLQYTDIERDASLYLDPTDSHYSDLGAQLLYSYKINPQSLIYLGFSNSGFQDDRLDSIEETQRSVFLKLSYAWLP